jgi:hypothetical protein
MDALNDPNPTKDSQSTAAIPGDGLRENDAEVPANPPAWVMIENGRYQPRRIRGSLLGRELG